jgi:hypothetical protein
MRRFLIVTVATAATLLGANSAGAAVTLSSFNATPSTSLAGGHPNFTTAFAFSYSSATDDVKSTVVQLPPGLTGNPNVATKCTVAQLSADNCPASSKIGTVSSTAKQDALPLLPPVTSTGDVYNVLPTGTEPARVGMVIRPLGGVLGKISMSGPATVRVPGDFGLTTTFDNLPRTLPLLGGGVPVGIQIQSISLTLNGVAPSGRAFMTNPTSCGTATTTATATSYESSTPSVRTSGYTPTDCAGVPFNPTAIFWPSPVRASLQEGVIAGVAQPGTEFPRSQAQIKKSVVYLPTGTMVNFAKIPTITPCTDAQLNVSSAAPPNCPPSSEIGVTVVLSPLVGQVIGRIYFGSATPTAPLRQFITFPVTATQTAKFIAVNNLLPGGVIQSTLDNLPQTPVSLFALVFPGLPRPTLLISPATCGNHFGTAGFFPFAQTPVGAFFNQVVDRTATGAPCPTAAAAQTFASPSPSDTNSAEMTAPATSDLPKRVSRALRSLGAAR